MDFGSTHIYAGESPYYSSVPKDDAVFDKQSNFDFLPGSSSSCPPANTNNTLYESLNEINQNHPRNGPFYDAVYPSINPIYDPVAPDPIVNERCQYEAVSFPSQNIQSIPTASTHHHKFPTQKLPKNVVGMLQKAKSKLAQAKKKVVMKPQTPSASPIYKKPLPMIPIARDQPSRHDLQAMQKEKKALPPTPLDNIQNEAISSPPPILGPKPLIDGNVKSSENAYSVVPPASNAYSTVGSVTIGLERTKLYPTLVNEYEVDDNVFLEKQNIMTSPRAIPSAPRPSESMIKRETRSGNPYSMADTNVVSVKLSILEDNANTMVWPLAPVKCNHCQAIILHQATAEMLKPGTCRFCGTITNGVMEEVLPLVGVESDVSFMLQPALCPQGFENDSIIVFCIDTSGSMCVTSEVTTTSKCFMSRLQGVQEGILNQLSHLKQSKPNIRVSLVTFSSEVTIIGDGTIPVKRLTDAELFDADYLKQIGTSIPMSGSIRETSLHLAKSVAMLREHGGTALGPALLISVAIASKKRGSQVILCTDGRANVGVGSLEKESDYKMCHNFYKESSEFAGQKGIVVSILSIEGTDCRLVELGKVADKTAGKVNVVNSSNLSSEFMDVLSNPLMATNVTVSITAQKELYFNDATEKCSSLVTSNVGNSTRETEITFKYGIKTDKDSKPPVKGLFQLQIEYLSPEGTQFLRVITQTRPVTENRLEAEKGLNPAVIGTYASQLASKLVLDGDLIDAKLTAAAHKNLLNRALDNRDQADDEKIYGTVCDFIDRISHDVATVVDSSSAAPALPPRLYESPPNNKPVQGKRTVSASSHILPDVPNSPIVTRNTKEIVEHCADDVASRLYRYRKACGQTFS